MSLTSSVLTALNPRAPERAAQELLLEFLQRWFTGLPHTSLLGDQVFPKCDLLFGDTVAPSPGVLPQIHGVQVQGPRESEAWGSGDASAWQGTLCAPGSGVAYGLTTDGFVEETVHGRVRRRIRGSDIRWRTVGSALVEEVFTGGIWVVQRTFNNTTSLLWVRDETTSTGPGDLGDYVELVELAMPGRTEVRRFTPQDKVWDGTARRVHGPLRIQWFVRVRSAGEAGSEPDYRCRDVTDCLVQLFQRDQEMLVLAQKGMRNWRVTPPVLFTGAPGMVVRTLMTEAEADWIVPVR